MGDKVSKESISGIDKRKEKLKSIFPEIFEEKKINLDKFKEIMDIEKESKEESYSFTWSGKKEAIKNIQTSSYGTLIPDKDESIDFDDSENLFIEGDNLEALKLLQKSYANKVKMIYIDPPYNTGGDFVYNDDFKDNIRNYLEKTGQVDSDGNKLTTNTESNGRFHSDWLSMMYPRLYLARNLLKEDGVIFVSIDDNELHNLKMVMNEIFGEENFISTVIWERAYAPINLKKHFSENHDYILCYAKNINLTVCNGLPRTEEANNRYSNPDNDPRGPWKSSDLSVGPRIEKKVYEITTPSGRKVLPPSGYCWRYTKKRFEELVEDNRIWFGEDGNNVPSIKRFLSEVKDSVTPMTIWYYKDVNHSQGAKQELKKIFDDESVFDYPKSVELIQRMIRLYSNENSIILDFFAGSATTAHAVLKQNEEDEGNRKFIMIQLPEQLENNLIFNENRYLETVSDIAKERIRRVIKGYGDNDPIDDGFKVFKLGKSNYKVWEELEAGEVTVKDVEKQLKLFDDTLIDGYRETDVIYEIIIKEGYSLNAKINKLDIDKYDIYKIEDKDKSLYVTLKEKINESIIENFDYDDETLFVCLDSALTDSDKINISLRLNLKTI
jgi:adenine-specific DNA-methyltransferase